MRIPKTTWFLGGFSIFMMIATGGSRAQQSPLAAWSFGEGMGRTAVDSVGNRQDAISNNFRWGRADRGGGLKFDGFTTFIERAPADAPKVQAAFHDRYLDCPAVLSMELGCSCRSSPGR